MGLGRVLRGWRSALGRGEPARRECRPLFEELEPRLLLAGDLPSISLIEADNRGLVVLTATADLAAATITSASVEVSTAGADQVFGTSDDTLVSRTVEYVAAQRQIRISAAIPADTRYRVRLDSSIITGADGRRLDGEFTGAATVSGDAAQGGDLIFYTRKPTTYIARFSSISGTIDATLFHDRTPLTVQNFLNYANRGVWDTTFIHRSVSGFVIQTGGYSANGTNDYPRIPQDPAVRNEPGISNVRGTLAMAKLSGNPNSATNEFFFNLANNASNLDSQNGGFTVFAEIRGSAGMAVMDALAAFETINAEQVKGAFTELPVVDSDAVLTRPGGLTVHPSDLIRFTRIALLVDISGEPPQQLNPAGSVVFTSSAGGEGARVQVYDLDQAGLGNLGNALQVRFGRGGAISSITIRDGLPNARIGIAITNATSVATITDARRNPAANVAFIISSAPVASIRLNGALSGMDLNGTVIPGLTFEDDIDGDGTITDPIAIFVAEGVLGTLRLAGGVTGDVVAPGGFGMVAVGGTATSADFDADATSAPRLPSFTFGRVVDSEIRTGVGIGSVRATEWADTGGRDERIAAPFLNSLRIDGDFQAGLNLTQNAPPRPTLGSARIGGSIFGSDWTVAGAIGSIAVGDATGWTIAGATNSGAISAGRLNNVAMAFSGRVARLTAIEWQGGSYAAPQTPTFTIQGAARQGVAGDFIASMNINGGGAAAVIDSLTINGAARDGTIAVIGPAGRIRVAGGLDHATLRVTSGDARSVETGPVINSTIDVQRTLQSLTAARFENAVLQGGAYNSITSRGDFTGEIKPTALNIVNIEGNFAGAITSRNANTVSIRGDLRDSTINFTLTPTQGQTNFQIFTVGGRMERTDFRAAGNAGHFFAGAMIDSGIYVGAPTGLYGLPSSGTGFRAGASLLEVSIRGLTNGEASFFNSFIVANDLNTVRLRNAASDNLGRVHGVAAGRINLVEARLGSQTLRLTAASTTPAPIGDFNVFVAFVPPPGTTI